MVGTSTDDQLRSVDALVSAVLDLQQRVRVLEERLTAPACAGCTSLAADLAVLKGRIGALERRGRGPRDEADEELLAALQALIRSGTFAAVDVVDRGRMDPAWRTRLEAADMSTAHDVGVLLRRCVGVRGLRRVDRNGRGVVWQFGPDDESGSAIVTEDDDLA